MKEILISKYIDNEMNLEEKLDFVKEIKKSDPFYKETIDLIKQEQLLSFNVEYPEPLYLPEPAGKSKNLRLLYPIIAAAAIILLILSITTRGLNPKLAQPQRKEITYRFVYYNPSAKSVQLVGSFTGWKRVNMRRIDGTGYWQIYLKLPDGGIYKYNFIINRKKIINDPTNPARIYSGFGGADSVLRL